MAAGGDIGWVGEGDYKCIHTTVTLHLGYQITKTLLLYTTKYSTERDPE